MHLLFKLSITALGIITILVFLVLAAFNGDGQVDNTVAYTEVLLPETNSTSEKQRVEKVKSGDTTGLILQRLGFPSPEAANIIQAAKAVYSLKNIHIGHKFIRFDTDEQVGIRYYIDGISSLVIISEAGKGWKAFIHMRTTYSRIEVVGASIQDSLFLAAAKAGLADNLILKLVDMFAWDIDFARDLRKGDSFKVLYEESYDDEGKRFSYKILAATFINRGRLFTGVRYKNQKGDTEYYNEDGRNLRKTYLKSPVKYSRISSRFRSSRKHPVLGYTRAHRGVDYAAKTGTPIRAIGDGKIVYKGRKGGYGRFIEIRHSNGIHTTAYAHMSRYAKGMKRGKYVQQGQVIGYVGMSGLATGPHLHFEFRSRGRAVNPLKVKYKPAKPVNKDELSAFRLKAKEMMRMMTLFDQSSTWD